MPEITPQAGFAAAPLLAAQVSIGSGIVGTPGATVHVPITIDNANTLQAIDFVIRYDTTRLNLATSDITLGGLLSGWTLTPAVNDAAGVIVISSFTTSALKSGGGTLFDLAFHIDPTAISGPASVDLPTAQNTFALNEGTVALTVVPGGIDVNGAGPTVTQVLLGSTGWSSDFQNYLAAHGLGNSNGYTIPFGADQTQALPWTGINKISVVFSEDVQVSSSDLQVAGVSTNYTINGFFYAANSRTATWTLSAPVGNDKLLLKLFDSVHDGFNKALDGEWTTNQLHGPSGDGVTGGDFLFRVNVLPGDATGDGIVNGADYTQWADHFLPFVPLNSAKSDLNGSGTVDGADYTVWADHFLLALPNAAPALAPVRLSVGADAKPTQFQADEHSVTWAIDSGTVAASVPSTTAPSRPASDRTSRMKSPQKLDELRRYEDLAWAAAIDRLAAMGAFLPPTHSIRQARKEV